MAPFKLLGGFTHILSTTFLAVCKVNNKFTATGDLFSYSVDFASVLTFELLPFNQNFACMTVFITFLTSSVWVFFSRPPILSPCSNFFLMFLGCLNAIWMFWPIYVAFSFLLVISQVVVGLEHGHHAGVRGKFQKALAF